MWVAVREVDFTDGRLPSVCVKTGVRADRKLGMTVRRVPGWIYLLLLCGVVPFFIAWWFGATSSHGVVPIAAEPLHRIRRAKVTDLALFAVAVGLIAAGSWIAAFAALGLLVLLVGLGWLMIVVPWLGIRAAIVVDDVRFGRCIILARVHPAFGRAVEDAGRALGSGD